MRPTGLYPRSRRRSGASFEDRDSQEHELRAIWDGEDWRCCECAWEVLGGACVRCDLEQLVDEEASRSSS